MSAAVFTAAGQGQMSLAYRHPGQELGPGLNVQARHQVHVEEDRDAGHEGDSGNLTRTLLRYLNQVNLSSP